MTWPAASLVVLAALPRIAGVGAFTWLYSWLYDLKPRSGVGYGNRWRALQAARRIRIVRDLAEFPNRSMMPVLTLFPLTRAGGRQA